MNIHSWLRRVPHPSTIRCDGKKSLLVGQGKNRWRDCINSIEALQPGMIEALDAEGNVIRVCHLNDDGPADATGLQDGAPVVPATEKEAELATIARIILEATDRGAERHAEAYRLAFEKHTELVSLLAHRLTAVESAWQKTLEDRARDMANAGGSDDQLAELMTHLPMLLPHLKKMLGGSAPAKPNGKPEA